MSCLICPVCKSNLNISGGAYLCESGHSFDISKDGYVNLLMSQQSAKKRHGDDKLMVRARRDFLACGYYKSLCDALCETVSQNVSDNGIVLDIGCGEGYYTSAILNSGEYTLCGIDISKDALKYASKSNKGAEFAVASAYNLPFSDNSADCIVNVFAPSPYEEFFRVLKAGGKLIKAVPLSEHLWDLKCALYDKPYKNKPEIRNEALFSLVSVEELKYTVCIDSQEQIQNLFKMTPYYYKTGRAEAQRLEKLSTLTTTVHFGLEIYEKR